MSSDCATEKAMGREAHECSRCNTGFPGKGEGGSASRRHLGRNQRHVRRSQADVRKLKLVSPAGGLHGGGALKTKTKMGELQKVTRVHSTRRRSQRFGVGDGLRLSITSISKPPGYSQINTQSKGETVLILHVLLQGQLLSPQ